MLIHEPVSTCTGDRALPLYEDRLPKQVETPENLGKILVLMLGSGDYEIDVEGIRASRRLRARRPASVPIVCLRSASGTMLYMP